MKSNVITFKDGFKLFSNKTIFQIIDRNRRPFSFLKEINEENGLWILPSVFLKTQFNINLKFNLTEEQLVELQTLDWRCLHVYLVVRDFTIIMNSPIVISHECKKGIYLQGNNSLQNINFFSGK